MKPNFWKPLLAAVTLQLAAFGETQPSDPPAAPRSTTVPPAIAGPKIEFATSVFNFGKVKAGEVVRHDFVFTNTGTITLDITDVRPGCGCTTAGEWSRRVEPGQSGSIPLQFNSSGFGGEVTKSATVACNDPGQTNIILQIIGTVWKPIEITPSMVVFNLSSDVQTNETMIARIVNNLEEPLTLSDLQSTNRSFQAELKTIRPGKEFELHITAVGPFNSPSTMATLSLKTSAPQMPLLNVSAYAMVQPAITVTPLQIILPTGPLTTDVSSAVTIRNNGANPITLSDASVNIPTAEVRLRETQPGRLFSLSVSFPAGFQGQPGQRGEVTVKSNDPRFPLIKVPVFQSQHPAIAPVAQSASPRSRVIPIRTREPAEPGK